MAALKQQDGGDWIGHHPVVDLQQLTSRVPAARLGRAFSTRARTGPGQILGLVLLVAPAVAHPLPIRGSLYDVVQIIAVVAGVIGMLIVFGGLLIRVIVLPAGDDSLDGTLLAIPRHRAVWLVLAGLCALFAVGGALALALGHDGERFAGGLLLGLPAVALGWAAWRARVMWTGRRTVLASAP